jgi:hypothetical protein
MLAKIQGACTIGVIRFTKEEQREIVFSHPPNYKRPAMTGINIVKAGTGMIYLLNQKASPVTTPSSIKNENIN